METIKLDLVPGKKMPSLHASQFDDGRVYHVDLTENRVPYVLDGTETISVIIRKCDNTLVSMDIANTFANKSYLEFEVVEQMTACSGFNYGEIILENNGDRLGSLNFYLVVEAAPDENGITSQSDIKNLNRQITDEVDRILPDMVEAEVPQAVDDYIGDNYYDKTEVDEIARGKADATATAEALGQLAEAVNGKASASDLQSLGEAVSGMSAKFNDFSEILPVGKEWQVQESVNSIQDKRATYNAQYQRITFANNQTYYACKVYPVTAGKYRIKGYGSDQNTTSVLAVVGNADIITSSASYCNLLQVIQTGSSTYGWHTVVVDIAQDGYLYVNYSYFSDDKTSTVEKEVAIGQTVVITDDSLTSEYLPANAKAVGDAIRNATQKNGIIKNGTTYQHFSYSHGNKFIFRTIAPVGANGLYDYKSVAVGHFDNGSAVIDTTFFTAFTDQIGPVSMRLSGDSGSNLWTGGVHTKTIDGTDYPTAQVQSIAVYVDGVDISNSEDGIYYGDCRIVTKNNLYSPATITGADLSTATLAIVETRTFILTDTLRVQVKLEFKEDSIVGLYYGMQNQDNHTTTILLPTVGKELARADMSSGAVSNSKEWAIMLSDSNDYHFDMLLDYFGLGNWDKNDGTSAYGRISHYSTTKIYFVLCSGGTFNQGDIMFWQGEYRTYHD